MAYKFQTGAAQMDGNLSQDGVLSGSGDLHLATAIDINGTEVLNSSGGGSGFTTANSLTSATALVSVSALNTGSIASGFGAIDNGTSNITTGGKLLIDVDGSAIDAAGAITLGAGADVGIYFDGGDLVLDGASGAGLNMSVAGSQVGSWDANGINLVTGDAFYINQTSVLNATTLGSAVVSSSLTSVGTLTSLAVGAVTSTGIGSFAGLTSSAGFQADSTMQLDGVSDVSASIQQDSFYYLDASDGLMHRELMKDFVSGIAGTGITATAGVLSVSADSSTPNAMSGGTSASPAEMDEGLNYGSTAMLGPEQYWTVPASGLALGDIVRVKAPSGVTADNFIRITASVAQDATFDGEKHINLESPYAAVSLFVISASPLIFRII